MPLSNYHIPPPSCSRPGIPLTTLLRKTRALPKKLLQRWVVRVCRSEPNQSDSVKVMTNNIFHN